MQYAYHNNGSMMQTGGGDKRALGSLGGGSTLDRPTLPAPGAPEVMAGMGDCGCGCKGAGTCGGALHGISDIASTTGGKIALAVAAYLAYKHFKKKR